MAHQEKKVGPKRHSSEKRAHTKVGVAHRTRLSSRTGAAKSYRSPAFAAIHEGMADLHEAGVIDTKTMHEFDEACLTPLIKLSPRIIRGIRTKASISQAVFAAHLNVTTGVISKWERGEKHPSGPAAKLLTLAAKKGIIAIA
jgi:putative transcriptional regulator